jgi:hypothetical protein
MLLSFDAIKSPNNKGGGHGSHRDRQLLALWIGPECNELVIAPERSQYVDNREVHHFWACENCGHEIEITVNLRTIAISKPINSVSLGA